MHLNKRNEGIIFVSLLTTLKWTAFFEVAWWIGYCLSLKSSRQIKLSLSQSMIHMVANNTCFLVRWNIIFGGGGGKSTSLPEYKEHIGPTKTSCAWSWTTSCWSPEKKLPAPPEAAICRNEVTSMPKDAAMAWLRAWAAETSPSSWPGNWPPRPCTWPRPCPWLCTCPWPETGPLTFEALGPFTLRPPPFCWSIFGKIWG